MRPFTITVLVVLGVLVTWSLVSTGMLTPKTASEIKELQTVQDKWVEQVELLIVIDRLSFNLQCAELDKKELFHALGNAVKANNELRTLVQSLFERLHGSSPNLLPDFDPGGNAPNRTT